MTQAHERFVDDWQQDKPVFLLTAQVLCRVWVPPVSYLRPVFVHFLHKCTPSPNLNFFNNNDDDDNDNDDNNSNDCTWSNTSICTMLLGA